MSSSAAVEARSPLLPCSWEWGGSGRDHSASSHSPRAPSAAGHSLLGVQGVERPGHGLPILRPDSGLLGGTAAKNECDSPAFLED